MQVIMREAVTKGLVTHREYYEQFVTPRITAILINNFGVAKLEEWHNAGEKASELIPLHEWDYIARILPSTVRAIVNATGTSYVMAMGVCIAKEAGRQIAEATVQYNG